MMSCNQGKKGGRMGVKMPKSDAVPLRVYFFYCKKKVNEKIKRISRQMGLRPSTWISMVATSKTNNIEENVTGGIEE